MTRTQNLALVLTLVLAGPAVAGPGDIQEVTAELANLRASPSDAASVRDRIPKGTQAIELRRDGGWVGVRIVPSGQEGWVYGSLLRQVESSQLGNGDATVGLSKYSGDLDTLLYQVNERLGAPMMAKVVETGNVLTLTPTESWLRATSQDTQLMALTAVYGMWKNYHNQSPVEVVLLDPSGDEYITIRDEGEGGPQLTVVDQATGSEG